MIAVPHPRYRTTVNMHHRVRLKTHDRECAIAGSIRPAMAHSRSCRDRSAATWAAVGGGLFFLRPGRRRGGAPPAPPAEAQRPGQGVGGEAGAAAGTIAPEAPLAPPVPPAPEIERPPPSAGRMVRLRARLARSQSAFGSVLLGLLSRDTI